MPGSKLGIPRPLPHRQIAVVTRFDSSGTTFAFTNHLAAISTPLVLGPGVGKTIDWPCAAMDARGNEGVAAMINRTPGAIGYVESGFADKAGLSVAVLENKCKNFIAPSAEAAIGGLGGCRPAGQSAGLLSRPARYRGLPDRDLYLDSDSVPFRQVRKRRP